jgi:hypothetical protein
MLHQDSAVEQAAASCERSTDCPPGELAQELGFPELTAALDRAFRAVLSATCRPRLRTDRRASFVVRPPSRLWWRAVWARQVLTGGT